MLTEIEWWGGLLIIWGALACWAVCHFNADSSNRVLFPVSIGAFALCGLAFALHFYELAQPVARYAFLGTAAAAGLAAVVFLLVYLRGGSDDEADESVAAQDADDSAEEEEEEIGWLGMTLSQVFLLGPMTLTLGLVGWKSWTLVQLL